LDYSHYDGKVPDAIDITPLSVTFMMLCYSINQDKLKLMKQLQQISLSTNDQGGNTNSKAIWQRQRRIRVTASNIGKNC